MRRSWVVGYIVALFGTTSIALPCWNGFLRDTLGRWITIQQIHLAQYAGLGAIVAFKGAGPLASLRAGPSRRLSRFLSGAILVLAVGLLEELFQGLLPQRHFEWSDVLLNWTGGALGLLIFVAGSAGE